MLLHVLVRLVHSFIFIVFIRFISVRCYLLLRSGRSGGAGGAGARKYTLLDNLFICVFIVRVAHKFIQEGSCVHAGRHLSRLAQSCRPPAILVTFGVLASSPHFDACLPTLAKHYARPDPAVVVE